MRSDLNPARIFRQKIRPFPGGEMAAPVELVEVDEVGIGLFGPAPRRLVLLAREDLTATGIETPLALKKPPLYSQ